MNLLNKILLFLASVGSLYSNDNRTYINQSVRSDFLCYMDYRLITNKDTLQYKLVNHKRTITGNYGIRNHEDQEKKSHYLVAVSKKFGVIGDIINIRFTNGILLEVIIGDYKKPEEIRKNPVPGHEISKNRYCVVEFIVDKPAVSSKVINIGGFQGIYPGNILYIEKTHKKTNFK